MPARRIAAAFAATIALAVPAAAEPVAEGSDPVCDDRSALVTVLQDLYGEQHHASGLEDDTSMLEIWVSEASGTWTILMTRPDGVSCIAAAGADWFETTALTRADGVLH